MEIVTPDRSPHQVMSIDTSSSSTISAFPKRPSNEWGQSESLTTAEFAASQVAKRMLADITDNFEANTKLDKSSARSGNRKLGPEGSEMEQSAAHSGESEWNETDATHSARQGCEDCAGGQASFSQLGSLTREEENEVLLQPIK
ncbi:MAG: hypothetical protein Q9204_000302 [Flavoplaca sp. TL-2023a]